MLFPVIVSAVPRPLADVPFELRGVHIYVQAKVNGQGPFPFNVDTGSFLGVSKLLAERLGVRSEKQAIQRGAGAGTRRIGWARFGSIEIGGARLDRLEGMVGEEGDLVEGGIGRELFERFTVELDNDHRRMRLYPKGQARVPAGATVLDLTFTSDGKPLVEASLGGSRGRFMLDTGGGVSMIMQKAFWTENRLDAKFHPPIRTIIGYGIGGPIRGYVGRIPELAFGRLILRGPIVTFSTMVRGSLASRERAGLIGQNVLLHFNSTFDYANRRLILTPSRAFAKRDSYTRTGLVGQVEGLGYQIEDILPRSPAEQAGLRIGDVIVEVDGQLTADERMVRSAFRRPVGTTLRLSILRGDVTQTRFLTLREVL